VTVALPSEESPVGALADGPDDAPETVDVTSVPPETVPRGVSQATATAGDAVGFLPEIIRTFAITDRTDPILLRLDTLLDTLHRWLQLSGAALEVVDDSIGHQESDAERVTVVTEDELRGNAMYAAAIESATPRLLPRAEWGEEHLQPAVPWETVGIAPVFGMGKVQGIVRLYFADGVDEAEMKGHLKIATAVVHQVIEFHMQIADLTSIDALTGIYNRHFFDIQLPVEVERAMRSGSEVALLLLDIDDFKKINDEIGHRKGDEALTAVAEIIRRNLRKVDIPFRYGGEEIVILLPGTSRFESVHTAERLRRRISEHDGFVDLHGHPRRITVSVGVGVYPETARTPDDLFMQADAAMYRAKEMGKNRVVLYSDDMTMGPRE
jgi:diguanylate cyclase (GGDEF)-like protein